MRSRRPALARAVTVALLVLPLTGSTWVAAAAPTGQIDHVEESRGVVQVLFSVDDLPADAAPDLTSLSVTLDGTPVAATATPASDGSGTRRSAMLVVDSSLSMQGRSFAEAKSAALAFVDQAPPDVDIGVVSFGRGVETVQAPTVDRALLRSAVARLQLSVGTHLHDGIVAALAAPGAAGQRRLLVITDGRDTTRTPLQSVVTAVRGSQTQVDVVGLDVSGADSAALAGIAAAGRGTLVNAGDASALTRLFSDEARALAGQLLVSFPVPEREAGSDASLGVSIDVGGATYVDSAVISLGAQPAGTGSATSPLTAAPSGGIHVSRPMLLGGIGAIGLSILLVVAVLLGLFRRPTVPTLEDRLAGYGTLGAPTATPESVNVKETALGVTERVLSDRVRTRLAVKLDASGLSLKPAEWVLLHAGTALGTAFVGFLLSSGAAPLTALAAVLGAVLPWLYLGNKVSRRMKAFDSQLAEGLQLISGGLKAGLSMAQSVDTIVREGTQPMAGEFRRALAQARLGVDIEDALDGVAGRMSSEDFRWVVMAIRIQRQVGGNLSELLLTVAGTLREREYLRRQVKTLTAEGRLSAWVLGGLPPAFLCYLMLTNGDYVAPMFHTPLGWAMLGLAATLLAVGAFWMSKTVKIDV